MTRPVKKIRAVLSALAILVIALPARAQTNALDVPEIEDVPASIDQLLDDYSRSWVLKDAALLGGTLDDGIAAAEKKAFANANDIPFETFEIRPLTQYSGDLASPRIRALYKGREVATYHVVERSRIGNETGTYESDGAFTFTRTSRGGAYDGWRLTSKDDLDALGFFSPYHLWDEAKVTLLSSEHFTLLTHPGSVKAIRPSLAAAEKAYAHDDGFWPGPPLRDKYVMIVPSTTEELGRIMHETVDLGKFVAFVSGGADKSRGWVPTGPRVFVHLSHLTRYQEVSQVEILAHELIHAITRQVSGPKVPTWIEEGIANLGGGNGGRPVRATDGPTPDEFPTEERFVTGSLSSIQIAYDQGQVAVEVLDAEFGREGLVKFYKTLGAKRVVPGTEEYWVRRAVDESTDWTYADWVAAWRERLD
jgi:hypothetical protein